MPAALRRSRLRRPACWPTFSDLGRELAQGLQVLLEKLRHLRLEVGRKRRVAHLARDEVPQSLHGPGVANRIQNPADRRQRAANAVRHDRLGLVLHTVFHRRCQRLPQPDVLGNQLGLRLRGMTYPVEVQHQDAIISEQIAEFLR